MWVSAKGHCNRREWWGCQGCPSSPLSIDFFNCKTQQDCLVQHQAQQVNKQQTISASTTSIPPLSLEFVTHSFLPKEMLILTITHSNEGESSTKKRKLPRLPFSALDFIYLLGSLAFLAEEAATAAAAAFSDLEEKVISCQKKGAKQITTTYICTRDILFCIFCFIFAGTGKESLQLQRHWPHFSA